MTRRAIILLIIAGLLALAGIFAASNSYFRSGEQARAQGRLSLYQSTIIAELDRFAHLPFVLARDPFVITATQDLRADDLNDRLASFASQANLDAIYLMRPNGVTLAASNHATGASFVGQNYGFRPYFQSAMQGHQGRFYGIGATTGLPGYFIADPVRNVAGDIVGVIAIKIDLTQLETAWRDSGEDIFLTDANGVVLLASDPANRYQTLRPLSTSQRDAIQTARQFSGQPLAPLEWSDLGNARAMLAGAHHIHLATDDLPHDWALHYFAPETPHRTRAWLTVVILAALGATGLIISQIRKTERIGAALRRSEAEEAALRQANARLTVEIEDRRTAERRLDRTRDELARASRLAALGELAASVTHELGQPIAAMRNHLAAAEMTGRAQSTMPKISGLVERMEALTKQLKFFANPGPPDLGPVDLAAAMRETLDLLAPNVQSAAAHMTLGGTPSPILVHGNKLRVEQVMTNILRNALDALDGADLREITISMGKTADMGWFEVQDTGHGLGAADLSHLAEPFVTSRASGDGMGLGLAISAGIVADHGGTMTARNLDPQTQQTGAVFRVEIPLYAPIEDTAP